MMMFLSTGCVEFAWNSEGHFATQAPKLTIDRKNKQYGWDYATPINSQEVVNAVPQQQAPVIVVQMPESQRPQTAPAEYIPRYNNKGTQLVTWGSLNSGGR